MPSVFITLTIIALAVLTNPSEAENRLNCRLMNPGDWLFRQHCKAEAYSARTVAKVEPQACKDKGKCKLQATTNFAKKAIAGTHGGSSTEGGTRSAGGGTLSGTTSDVSRAVGGILSSAGGLLK